MTREEPLLDAIAFAIGKTPLKPRSRIAADNDRERFEAARVILEHLKLCGYTITPGPLSPLHTAGSSGRETSSPKTP